MDIRLEILSLLLIIGAAQGYFLSILLLRQSKRQPANLWLAFLVALISSAVLSQAFEINGLLNQFLIQYPQLYGIIDPMIWLFGPFYFFFIHRLLKTRSLKRWEYLLHFFPALLKALSLAPFFILSKATKLQIIEQSNYSSPGISSEDSLFMLTILLYLGWSTWEIFQFRKKLRDKKSINWLWYLNLIMLGAWVFQVFALLLHQLELNPLPQSDYLVVLGWVVGIYAIGYVQWSRSPQMKVKDHKYARSGLKRDVKKDIGKKLLALFSEQKVFKNPDLDLKKLAESLSTSPHHLSEVINDQFQLTFYDFVNSYRVKEAQNMLKDSQHVHLTILAVSYEVGFNSKSAFNRAFKKISGQTPSAFKKQNASDREGRAKPSVS